MNIQELKGKTSEQLIDDAEKLGIENASTLRKQDQTTLLIMTKCKFTRQNSEPFLKSTRANGILMGKSLSLSTQFG